MRKKDPVFTRPHPGQGGLEKSHMNVSKAKGKIRFKENLMSMRPWLEMSFVIALLWIVAILW